MWCRTVLLALPADKARAGHERLDRVEVLAGLLVDRDRRQVRVAARVDRERPEDAVGDREAEDRLRGRRPLSAALGDRPEGDVHGLRTVRGVRVRGGTDLLAEALDESGDHARQSLRRLAGDADIRAVAYRPVRIRIAEAVGHLQLDLRINRLDVLHQLRPVVADDAAEEDGLRARCLDPGGKRLVARRLRVPALEAGDGDAELLRRRAVRAGDAETVRLLVVQDVHLLVAERLRP